MKEVLHVISSDGDKGKPYPIFGFFNVAELHEKLKINFSDILLVTADEDTGKNKLIWLKDATREYTLMNVSFTELLQRADNLVMVNKFTLISIEAVYSFRYDFITLKNLFPGWDNKQVTLGRIYRKDFYNLIGK